MTRNNCIILYKDHNFHIQFRINRIIEVRKIEFYHTFGDFNKYINVVLVIMYVVHCFVLVP